MSNNKDGRITIVSSYSEDEKCIIGLAKKSPFLTLKPQQIQLKQ